MDDVLFTNIDIPHGTSGMEPVEWNRRIRVGLPAIMGPQLAVRTCYLSADGVAGKVIQKWVRGKASEIT
jgi:hypothetical protein